MTTLLSRVSGYRPAFLRDALEPGSALSRVTEREINLKRVQLIGAIGLIDLMFEGWLSAYRQSPAMGVESAVGILIVASMMFLAWRSRGGRASPADAELITHAFLLIVLLLSIVAGYLISKTGRVAFGFGLSSLGVSAIFLIHPRRFAFIMGVTFTLYTGLTLASDLSMLDKVIGWFNTSLAVGAAVAVRSVLYKLRQRERQQLALIARQHRQLQRNFKQLEAFSSDLNEVMALAAHDLRSPLQALRSLLVHVAGREQLPIRLYRDVLEEGSRSITSMLELVDRLLQAHALESRPAQMLEPVDLSAIAREVVACNALEARQSGVGLRNGGQDQDLVVLADARILSQVLTNLLTNAIRFSPPGAEVEVRCLDEGRRATIQVLDRGSGVPLEDQLHIFQKFRRGSNEPVQGSRGTGLGLYIASRLASSIGGLLTYSDRAGGGSEFAITFQEATSEPKHQEARRSLMYPSQADTALAR